MLTLNDQQKAAVETESTRALVLAGAGSGKTRVLVERIAHLIENKKVSPFEIIGMTFTRKAGGEMKSRLEDRLGKSSWGIQVGTMHAFALKMLHKFGEVLGLKPNTTVYCEWEEQFIIRDVAASLGALKGKTWKIPKRDIDDVFQGYYRTGAEPSPDCPGYNVFKGVVARFWENNSLSYGSLLIGLKALLPTLRKYLTVKYLFVDEIQDNDELQWTITNEICRLFNASLFVVGDLDQSIFEWRGACPKYLLEHQNEFDIYHLQANYRSGGQIVSAANRLIRNNVERIDHSMVATREGGAVTIRKEMDSDRIALSADSSTLKPDAILSRNHVLLQSLATRLDELNIPYNYVGQKSKLTNTEAFRRFHAFLKLIVNPMDNFSFLLIKDIIDLSAGGYSSIRLEAITSMQSHFLVWLKKYADEYATDLFTIDYSRDMETAVSVLVELLTEYSKNTHDFSMAAAFAQENMHTNIQDYLDWLATYDIQEEVKDDDSRLQLMTIHAAKGLEWPSVMIIGCNEGSIPSKQAEKNGDIEAERRLMYVAMTRAENNLVLAVRPVEKEYHGKVYENPVSRFIGEALH